jgi:hypothetical protein
LARFGQRAFQLFRVLKGRSIALQAVDQQDASPDLVGIVSRHVPGRVDDVLHDAAVPVAVLACYAMRTGASHSEMKAPSLDLLELALEIRTVESSQFPLMD